MAKKGGGKYRILLYAAPVLMLLTWPVVKWARKANTGDMRLSTDARSAFNSQEGELRQETPVEGPVPVLDEGDLGVHYQTKGERKAAMAAAQAEAMRQQAEAGAARKTDPAAGAEVSDAQRAHEQQFLRRHDGEVRQYQNYLSSLGNKYMNPEVAGMDAEFAGMPRYMALNAQYKKDRDAYKWARGAAGLPEVRAALVRYSSNKQVLRAVSGVVLEALKNPPPAAVYKEALRFFTVDGQMVSLVRELAQSAAGNAAKTLNQAVPPGTDTAPLTNLAMQLAGGNTQAAGPEPPSIPDQSSLDSGYPIPTRCVSGASAYRQRVINAITAYASANPAAMTPDDSCYPPYRVASGGENAYAAGVVAILTGWGYSSCQLPWAGDVIAVKRTPAFHEEYDFLTSKNCARAFGADTCRPAGF